jgi:hypothetical protein
MPMNPPLCDPWPVDRDCWSIPPDTTEDRIEYWQKVASDLLRRLTGGVLGPGCPVTVRPCRTRCGDGWSWGLWGPGAYLGAPWVPYIGPDGLWRNASVCGCRTDCSCSELCEIRLPGPVFDIVSVQDGVIVLPQTAYRVDNARNLVRTDGNCWNDCQDMAADPGEANTMTVTYRIGLPLDDLATAAISALTEHYIKGCGGCGCGIGNNRNVTRVQRQGVTLEYPDAGDLTAFGRTGLEIVDAFIQAVNPLGLNAPLRVLSPDFRAPRATTWP